MIYLHLRFWNSVLLKVLPRISIPTESHDLQLFRRPLIQITGSVNYIYYKLIILNIQSASLPNKSNVHTHPPVHGAAIQANENAKSCARPRRVTSRAIKAHFVFLFCPQLFQS